MPLICFDCRLKRNRMASPVFTKPTHPKEAVKIIGWCCIKCFKKRKVAERPKGIGWRMAFNHLLLSIRKKGQGKI